jgi:hypothetical protein
VVVLALVLVLLDSVVMLLSIIMTSSLVSSASTMGIVTSSRAHSGRVIRVHIKMSKNMSSDREPAEYVECQDLRIPRFCQAMKVGGQ